MRSIMYIHMKNEHICMKILTYLLPFRASKMDEKLHDFSTCIVSIELAS